MKNLIFLLISMTATLANASDLPCTMAQVQSIDSLSGLEKFGNAFAIDESHLLVNDHTLTADPNQINVYLPKEDRHLKAQVVHRDFHTDLALLKVSGLRMSSCPFDTSSDLQTNQTLKVVGSQKGASSTQIFDFSLLDSMSRRLKVPGVRRSLELKSDLVKMTQGRSGSVVFSPKGLVGMLSQKTQEGTVLAIPAQVLKKRMEDFKSNTLPQRKYKLDYRKNTIEFRGLEINKGGNPHEGYVGGNPHEGKRGNSPISLEDYSLGYAMLVVKDMAVLKHFEADIARALLEAKAQRLFISSIDNIPTRNEFEFLQVLGDCGTCRITSYWIEVENPAEISNKNLRLIAWTTQLVSVLDKSDLDREFVRESVKRVQDFHQILSREQSENSQNRINPKTKNELHLKWELVEQHLDKIFQSEELLATMNEIRREI